MAGKSDQMNYRRAGSGPTMVLVHGFLLGSGFWDRVIERFKDRYDLIAPDLHGFAGSGHLPPMNSIAEHADSVLELLDQLGVGEFILMGHSMGGSVAQQMALTAGARVQKLIVYGSSSGPSSHPANPPHKGRSPEERRAVLEKEGIDGLRRWMAPYWFAAGEDSPYLDECCQSGVGGSADVMTGGGSMMRQWDITDRLAEITVPTLVIGGDRDKTFAVEAMAVLARGVPDGRLAIIPEAAHCPHFEAPEPFYRTVESFLA